MTAKIKLITCLALIAFSINAYQEDITLGPNLIFNNDFSQPKLPSNTYMKSFPPSILGWQCLTYCYIEALPLLCSHFNRNCHIPYVQGIDLNSQCIFQNVTQTIYLEQAGDYAFHLQYTVPMYTAVGKRFTIWLNSTVVINITHNSSSIIPYLQQFNFSAPQGNLTISMMMTGGPNDCWGTIITNVSVAQIIYPQYDPGFQSLISFLMNNNATSFANQLPGNRIFLNILTNQYRLLDRMEFYYYHKQQFSYYSQIFLANLNEMMLSKGSMLQVIMQSCEDTSSICTTINNGYNYLSQRLNQKYDYTDSDYLKKNPNGMGFYANNLDFFYYQLPFVLLIHLIFALLFKLLFNYRVSLLLRKYSFYGTMLFIVYEGNVEIFSFYFFGQCLNLFSQSVVHKVANIFMIGFFFMLIFYVIGGMLWFTFHYRKLMKYFIEDYDVSVDSVVLEALERSTFPLVFGAVHILLKENLSLQTIVLFSIQIGYISMRIISLRSSKIRRRLKVFFSFSASLFRLIFITTFYFYQKTSSSFLLNNIHLHVIVLYLITGVLQFLQQIFNSILQIKEAIQKWFRKKQIQKDNQKTKKELSFDTSIKLTKQLQPHSSVECKTPKNIMIKERNKNKQVSRKKVKILTDKTIFKPNTIYYVKEGKVYSLSNLEEPISQSEAGLLLSRTQSRNNTINVTSIPSTPPTKTKKKKSAKSCQIMK